MTFHDPLALLLLFPLVLFSIMKRKKPANAIFFPAVADLSGLPKTMRQRSAQMLPWMSATALTLAVIALARPQVVNTETTVISKGVDIVLAVDLSTSMLAVDRGGGSSGASRLTVAKGVAREFISRRTGDRVGVVAFAARPYPVAPLTLDHDWLASALDLLEIGAIEDGTALGDGLLAALNRLRDSAPGSRAVLLLTDGRENSGSVSLATAANVARSLGVRVHTIGIGGSGGAEFPVEDPLGGVIYRRVAADLDEGALKGVAGMTGGSYFRADDKATLAAAFAAVDRLEKRPVVEKVSRSTRELYPQLLLAAVSLLLTVTVLSCTWLGRLP